MVASCDQWEGSLNSTCMEALNFLLVSVVGIVLDRALRNQVHQEVQCRNTCAELSAASSLLHLTCDAVLELDEDLRLAESSPQLCAMLLRDPVSVEGMCFTDFMPTDEEAARTREILKGSPSYFRTGAFHTRLVDSCSSKFRTEVFHVSYTRMGGGCWHLLGLRDFTDQGSLAGQNAVDSRLELCEMPPTSLERSMPEVTLSPRSPTGSSTGRGRTHCLHIDMDAGLVTAASVAISRYVGQALDQLFGSLEVQFLSEVWQQVQVLFERRALKNKDFSNDRAFAPITHKTT